MIQGNLTRIEKIIYKGTCGDCGSTVTIDAMTKSEAASIFRKRLDWSLGRDKVWRCDRCRPARFGEGVKDVRSY